MLVEECVVCVFEASSIFDSKQVNQFFMVTRSPIGKVDEVQWLLIVITTTVLK